MILRTPGGNRETRDANVDALISEFGPAAIIGTGASSTGADRHITSLPPVGRAVSMISMAIASMRMEATRISDGVPEVVTSDPRHRLIGVAPNPEMSADALWEYVAVCLLTHGNAYILKGRDRTGRVTLLYPISPTRIRVEPRARQVTYKYREPGTNEIVTLTRSDLIHIVGKRASDNPYVGVSPITRHRLALGEQVAIHEHSATFWANDASPAMALRKEQGQWKTDEKKLVRETLNDQSKGPRRAGSFVLLPANVAIEKVGISPRDSQYIEQRRYGSRVVAMAYDVPLHLLDPDERVQPPPTEQLIALFQTMCLQFWIRRITGSLNADDDLFGASTDLFPRLRADEWQQLDVTQRAEVNLRERQAGIKTSNEIRKPMGLPAHPDGDTLQATPVGGESNPDKPDDAPATAPDDDEEDDG